MTQKCCYTCWHCGELIEMRKWFACNWGDRGVDYEVQPDYVCDHWQESRRHASTMGRDDYDIVWGTSTPEAEAEIVNARIKMLCKPWGWLSPLEVHLHKDFPRTVVFFAALSDKKISMREDGDRVILKQEKWS